MSIDKELIKNKLQKLDDHLMRIENMHFSEEELVNNTDYQDLITFRLLQSVEICIDIASHLIAELKLTKPDNARSSFEVLSGNKIISSELADKLAYAVSFRNLAVHGYEHFDFKRLFHDYHEDINDIKEFMKATAIFIEKYTNA